MTSENSRLRCTCQNRKQLRFNDDNVSTVSSREQEKVEQSVDEAYETFKSHAEFEPSLPELDRKQHCAFLWKGLENLSESYDCLDASRPWLCFWILHSLEILGEDIPCEIASRVAKFLGHCQSPDGGFGGGPGQVPHLAPTYAAVCALCILQTEEAFKIINRKKLQEFLFKMRSEDGAFNMHEGGEEDIRGAYCAATVARLTNVMTPELFDCTPEWIVSCQTYEGGFAGCAGMEAHGGYSFCGLAALILMGKAKLCNIKALLRWTANRQMNFEGGFQGRTNKLVDGCYSFWQGGAFPLVHMCLAQEGDKCLSAERWMSHQEALQEYLLICCQHPWGGLIDKPGKPRDYYHTCYALSGLSLAQHFAGGKLAHKYVIGSPGNEVKTTHPVFNIGVDAVLQANQYFKNLPVPSPENAGDS
ncbi:LOW QUALITY PROTEIN: protein farnesyltransferase subunit beta-like [Liolophura sinensis]|uniref:LOW QUALITY PROTEIN: protein farnesyltransferase subunit beta-like n=1 Tax=Liolophura sinensis TaxID=3198878 RepID=UPI0031580843